MTIEFANTMDDVIAFNEFHMNASKAMRRTFTAFAICYGFLFGASFWAAALFLAPRSISPLAWPFLVGALLVGTFGFSFSGKRLRKRALESARKAYAKGKNKGMVGSQRLTLTERSLRDESESGHSERFFDALESVQQSATHVFIYTSANSAHIIPKNAVSSGDLPSFVAELARRIAEAS